MGVMDLIKARRSVRKFSPRAVEPEKLEQILEAGRLAPSARNAQDWLFIAVTDEETRKAICEGVPQAFAAEAPVILLGCGKKEAVPMRRGQPRNAVDLSIASAFQHLVMTELGLGGCWMGNFDADVAAAAVGLPEDMTVLVLTPLGYPAEEPDARPRRPFEEVCRS